MTLHHLNHKSKSKVIHCTLELLLDLLLYQQFSLWEKKPFNFLTTSKVVEAHLRQFNTALLFSGERIPSMLPSKLNLLYLYIISPSSAQHAPGGQAVSRPTSLCVSTASWGRRTRAIQERPRHCDIWLQIKMTDSPSPPAAHVTAAYLCLQLTDPKHKQLFLSRR